ncbi:hypothetical protein LJR129_004129 [Acidovorax sp. LjRoot129]|uniref:hypothetical protein n=1 Tax=Acidovorax sp. LjRoot129 TaxID=3342260 RepID=UPI003ECF09E4
MNPQESLDFFATQLSRSSKGLEVAHASRNLQLAALNTRQMFKGHLMCGLIKWRQGESPVRHFEDAVRVVSESSELLRSWDTSFEPIENLPSSRAALLASLLGSPFESGSPEKADLAADVHLDYLLAEAREAAGSQQARAIVARLLEGKRTSLAGETYQTYFEVLSAQPGSEALTTLVGKAEALFTKRGRDAFFSGGDQTEGGGPDNALVVDYRLGVALKKMGYRGPSIHAWAW